MFRLLCFTVSFGLLLSAMNARSLELHEAFQVTEVMEQIEFARNTQGAIELDSKGNVHLVYFIPGSGSTPVNEIYHQMIEGTVVSEPVRVDQDSLVAIHPVMVVDHQDNVHVVWHDRRDATAAGNYFDNVEIYYDYLTPDKSFGEIDTRITHSNAGHMGDNSYLPLILQTQDLRLHIIWYDFFANGSVADAYLLSSDENGKFETLTNLEQSRITHATALGQNSVWMPTFAETAANHIYVVYGQQASFTDPFELKGFERSPDGSQTDVEIISPTGSSFFDPPRLTSDGQGNLGLVYQNRIDGIDQVVFQYKPLNGAWSELVVVSSEDINASQPDIDFDADGHANIVWREETGLGWFVKVDSQNLNIIEKDTFSETSDYVLQPVITINRIANQRHIAWVSEWVPDEAAIFLVSEILTNVNQWQLY